MPGTGKKSEDLKSEDPMIPVPGSTVRKDPDGPIWNTKTVCIDRWISARSFFELYIVF